MGSDNKHFSFGGILFALMAAAIVALPVIAGYMYFSHTPLTTDQLIDVTGHVARWKVERYQASGRAGGSPSDTTDLTIYTDEHRTPFYVSDSFYEDPKYFNATRFEREVKKGDALAFAIRKADAGLTGDGRVALYGLASQKAVYLNVDSAIDYDMQKHRTSLFLFIGALALLVLMLVVARMLWRDRKRQRQ